MSTIWTTQLTLSLKRVKHSRTTQQIAVIIAYLLLLSRRNAILMSPAAVSGQNLYLEIARTRSDGKLDFAQPKQSSNSEKWSKDRSTSVLTSTFSHLLKDDRNGGKTERTWHLMWKTADTYVTEGQVTADNSVLSSFNSYVTKMPRTDT